MVLPATIFNVLCLWAIVVGWCEPKWVRKIPPAKSSSSFITQFFQGKVVGVVKTGQMARRNTHPYTFACAVCARERGYSIHSIKSTAGYMRDHIPNMLKFQNGILGGWFRDVVLCKVEMLSVHV